MSMDTWLAQAYGTNGASAEDLQKIAQAEMAQQMAQQDGVDLSSLSEEQIAHLGGEMLGQQGQGQGGQPQQPGMPGQQEQGGQIDPSQLTEEHVQQAQEILEAAQTGQQVDPAMLQEAQAIMQIVQQSQGQQQPGQQEMAKVAEAQAKFEEADFLGRVMAHSFNQESEKIAASKMAGGIMGQAAHHAGAAAHAVGHHAGQAAHAVDQGAQHLGKKLVGAIGRTGGAEAKMHPHTARAFGYGAAGAGALGAGAAAHHMAKEATIGAIEKAAMQQAANILQANGIDPTTGQPAQQQAPAIAPPGGVQAGGPVQTGAGPQAALGDLVEKRAHQILRGLGWNI